MWKSTVDDDLVRRFAALSRFTRVAEPYVRPGPEAEALDAARELTERADVRLSTGDSSYTVVALAGATGVGKSSLFIALAGMPLSPEGHLRPTTSRAHACVWDGPGAGPLLDWLGLPTPHRFVRESALDADDEAGMRGLVLLDLPDVDSIATGNRIESDRLVGVVDLVIWVLDPQKYADATVHEQYLRELGALRDVTVVVFNQIDLLTTAETEQCRADLVRLVEADGLAGVPVLATSAVTGAGVAELRELLEKTVAARLAAVARLEGELEAAVSRLMPLAPHPAADEAWLSREAVPELADGLASASVVDALAMEVGQTTRAAFRLMRLRRLDSLPPTPAADPAAAAQAVRWLADRAGAQLPDPWSRRLSELATSQIDALPGVLGEALSATRTPWPVPPLWTVLRWVWCFAVATVLFSVAMGLSTMEIQAWAPVAVGSGAVTVALPLLAAGSGAWAARRRTRVVERRLRLAVLTVARELVAPVRQVLRDYEEAQSLLQVAATTSRPRR